MKYNSLESSYYVRTTVISVTGSYCISQANVNVFIHKKHTMFKENPCLLLLSIFLFFFLFVFLFNRFTLKKKRFCNY